MIKSKRASIKHEELRLAWRNGFSEQLARQLAAFSPFKACLECQGMDFLLQLLNKFQLVFLEIGELTSFPIRERVLFLAAGECYVTQGSLYPEKLLLEPTLIQGGESPQIKILPRSRVSLLSIKRQLMLSYGKESIIQNELNRTVALLMRNPQFSHISETRLTAFAKLGKARSLSRSEFLHRIGDKAYAVWLLLDGLVSLQKGIGATVLSEGHVFGVTQITNNMRFQSDAVGIQRQSYLLEWHQQQASKLKFFKRQSVPRVFSNPELTSVRKNEQRRLDRIDKMIVKDKTLRKIMEPREDIQVWIKERMVKARPVIRLIPGEEGLSIYQPMVDIQKMRNKELSLKKYKSQFQLPDKQKKGVRQMKNPESPPRRDRVANLELRMRAKTLDLNMKYSRSAFRVNFKYNI